MDGQQVARAVASTDHSVRLMTSADVAQVLDVWKTIGLHEGTHTIHSFLKIDPLGFYVSIENATGRIIGMCAAVFACTDTAFVGLYAILPQFQGQGLGLELWTLCMQHVGNRNAGLYAVPSQVSTYRDKAGFRCEDSCKMLVYDGDAPLDSSKLVQVLPNVQLCHFDETLEDAVAAYDQGVVGYDRKLLLHETLREPDSLTLVAKGKLDNGSVVGYASFRTNNIGKCMVGPLYADNDAIAEFLVTTALASFGAAQSHGVLFMPLDGNSGGVTIATKLGLELHEDLPRFFTKHIPSASMDKIYCVHTPNFSPF